MTETDYYNQKGCLIDDIVRVKKMLFAFGYEQHNEFLTHQGRTQLVDNLADMDIQQLELVMAGYEKQINEHLSKIK